MKHFNDIKITDFCDDDLIRIANFCEMEFGDYGDYEFNDFEGLLYIIHEFEFDSGEIAELLYNNKEIKEEDAFLYCSGKSLYSINTEDMYDIVKHLLIQNISNGELKEIVQECLEIDLEFD